MYISVSGLSPRIRGNPEFHIDRHLVYRSIPAYTGEPLWQRGRTRTRAVYPRVYGGTIRQYTMYISVSGLSPRIRGNPEFHIDRHLVYRSIPAYTGEPLWQRGRTRTRAVYPRVYGGTRMALHGEVPSLGLSPRIRGNPSPPSAWLWASGSIPAYTGEPERRGLYD